MKVVVWTLRAIVGLSEIRAYIEQFNPHAATRVAQSLAEAGLSLAHFPGRGRVVLGTDMRECVAVPPYIIRYRVVGDTVAILRVRHAARAPTNP